MRTLSEIISILEKRYSLDLSTLRAMTEDKELIRVKDTSGREFNMYYAHGVWIEEGTHFYYDDDDWAYGVLRRID